MSTTAYGLNSILSAQLRAVLEAEADNAEAIADFLLSVGFEKSGEDGRLGALRMVEFEMQRRNDDGGYSPHRVRIPLLSILPIPMLSIDRADFEFDLDVHDVESRETDAPGVVSGKRRPARHLLASFGRSSGSASQTRRRRDTTVQANMSVKVSMVQTDFPLGVERLLSLADLGAQDDSLDS